MSKRTLMKVDVRYIYDFGKLNEDDELPTELVQEYLSDGGNPVELEKAMPHQVYLKQTEIVKYVEEREWNNE
jgi:hypothetical protein